MGPLFAEVLEKYRKVSFKLPHQWNDHGDGSLLQLNQRIKSLREKAMVAKKAPGILSFWVPAAAAAENYKFPDALVSEVQEFLGDGPVTVFINGRNNEPHLKTFGTQLLKTAVGNRENITYVSAAEGPVDA